MAQHDYVIANGTGAAVRSDLNNALAAIVSNNSGATEPATMYAYQWWADTSTGLLKLRNAANNAWITLRELDGTLTIEDGTASSPGLAFADDLNTGIYSPSADQLGITTGGTVRLTTTTTGITSALPVDVPLGTASAPTVTFTGDLNTGIYSPGADQVAISTGGSGRVFVSDNRLRLSVGSQFQITDTLDTNGLQLFASTAGDCIVGTLANQSLVFRSNNSDRLRITGGGRVQLPTTSQFQITDNADVTGLQFIGSSSAASLIGTMGAHDLLFRTNSAERFRCDTSGRLLVGTSTSVGGYASKLQVASTGDDQVTFARYTTASSPGILALQRSGSGTLGTNAVVQNGDNLFSINFLGADGTNYINAASVSAAVDGTPGANDMPGRLVFSTTADGASSPTEAMRITQNRETRLAYNPVANVTTTAETNGGTDGIILGAASGSFVQFAKQSGAVGSFNRQVDDGTIVSLRQAGTEEGTISVSGNTVSYNQFLGSHWAALADWSRPEIKLGTILETINELMDWKYTIIEVDNEQKKICYNGTAAPGDTVSVEYEGETYEGIVELESDPELNKAVKVKVNETAASKAVYGVFVGWNNDSSLDGGTWNDMYVGAVGNYVIRMAAGQEPEIGDLVEADGAGCAVVQDDDIIRTKTVAKITSTIPQVTYDDGSFLVTCVLYCG